MATKEVFVIMPMNNTDHFSKIEWQKFYEDVIYKNVTSSGFACKRSDSDITRGSLIKNLVKNLASSYVVLADITDYNPNVMYELGIRHALAIRTIIIVQKGIIVPFDLKTYWYMEYDPNEKSSVDKLTLFIKNALENIHHEPYKLDNPIADFISTDKIKISRTEKEHYELAINLVELAEKRLYIIERTPVLLVKDISNEWQRKWFVSLNKWLDRVICDPGNKTLGLLFIASKTAKSIRQLDLEDTFFENLDYLKCLEAQTPGRGLIISAIPEYCGSFIVSDNRIGIWYKTDTNETGIYILDSPKLADAYEETFFRLIGEKSQPIEEIRKMIKSFKIDLDKD